MIIDTLDALVVVDVQRDFCPGGALAVSEGDTIIPGINAITRPFAHRVFTRDWHPANHCSFSEEPKFVDGSWPVHCVANTAGAAFHSGLVVPENALIVSKGTDPAREAYSGFDGTSLADTLRERRIERLFVCGLATDYCVKATVLDGVRYGFEVYVLEDLTRGVGPVEAAIEAMKAANAIVCASSELA